MVRIGKVWYGMCILVIFRYDMCGSAVSLRSMGMKPCGPERIPAICVLIVFVL